MRAPKRLLLSALALVCIVAVALYFRARHATNAAAATSTGDAAGANGQGAGRVVPVLTMKVEPRDLPIYLDGLGSVIAYKTVTVRTQVDGRLDEVLFREGQPVKRGQALAQIDPRPFLLQEKQAQGALARDSALLKDTRQNLERYTKLRAQNLIAAQQVDDQAAQVGQYAGAVAVDEAQIASARLNLDYARIISPIDGVTGVRLVDPGNIVHASDQTGLVVVTQLDPIAVLFTLPEDDLPRVQQALAAGPVSVEAWSRDGAVRLATGRVELVDNQINQATATIRLKAIFDNPERLLWPNQFVKARLLLALRKGVMAVPTAAVQHGPQGLYAYVVAPDQTAAMKALQVESTSGDTTIVDSGLSVGDLVVTEGQSQLRPGSKVAPRDAKPDGGGKKTGTGNPPGGSDRAAAGGGPANAGDGRANAGGGRATAGDGRANAGDGRANADGGRATAGDGRANGDGGRANGGDGRANADGGRANAGGQRGSDGADHKRSESGR